MNIVERGSGAPIVLIPGLDGRWEYQRPAIEALARSFRVLTFPLCGERACGVGFDPKLGMDNYVAQVVAALDGRRIDRAVICGVSFGGLVAIRFALAHPERIAGLVLVSTPGPTWRLRKRRLQNSEIKTVAMPPTMASRVANASVMRGSGEIHGAIAAR